MDAFTVPDTLKALAECCCKALEEEGSGPLCWCGHMVAADGAVSWDMCGDECLPNVCGLGYVALNRVFPYRTFPVNAEFGICDGFFGMELVVGALRCAPVLGQDGEPPTPAEVAGAASKTALDMFALLRAIKCCDLYGDLAVVEWNALGPAGGCQGGEWTILVGDSSDGR